MIARVFDRMCVILFTVVITIVSLVMFIVAVSSKTPVSDDWKQSRISSLRKSKRLDKASGGGH